MSRPRGRSRTPRQRRAICPSCLRLGLSTAAGSEEWCHRHCEPHALELGYAAPRSISPVQRRVRNVWAARPMCALCARAGVDHPSRSESWCKGLCKQHARSMGYREPGRKTPPRRRTPGGQRVPCPDCKEECLEFPARTEKVFQGYCRRHARARGFISPGRKAPARDADLVNAHGQKRRRCQEDGCVMRARICLEATHLCLGHAAWRNSFKKYSDLASASCLGQALAPQSKLGLWMQRQRCRMLMKGLSASQAKMLQSLPARQRSMAAFRKQMFQDVVAASRE